MPTEKLYYQDPFLREFPATVLSCREGKRGWEIELDQTAFYPEGGGQPCDLGTLGGRAVTEVREREGAVIHFCDGPLQTGQFVSGSIDWPRRFDHMQQHSGEHICSGLICERCHCDNVGFHMGADTVTIDYNAEIPWEALLEIEARANQYICEDHPIDIQFYEGEALNALAYRSKKALAGEVRIVRFPGADCCACCGTHVLSSGQVGLVKFLSVQKFREGVRIEMQSGRRALDTLSAAWEQARRTGQKLSVKPQETFSAVERVCEELNDAKARIAHLEESVFSTLAKEQAGRGDVLLLQPPMKPDSVRRLADAVGKNCGGLAAVFSGEGDHYNYALIRADGQDVGPLVRALNAALNGRGGGKKGFAQGSVACGADAIERFWEERP